MLESFDVLVALRDPDQRKELAALLRATGNVRVVEGDSFATAVRALPNVDMVILELLPSSGMDGAKLLLASNSLNPGPKTVALIAGAAMKEPALHLGAQLVCLLPCAMPALAAVAARFLRSAVPFSGEEIGRAVVELGGAISAPLGLEGFRQTRVAVELLLAQPQLLRRQFTKVVYPSVAQTCGTDALRVERNFRTFIDKLYVRANLNKLAKYGLDALPRARSGNPAPSTFLRAFSQLVFLNLQENHRQIALDPLFPPF